MVLSSIKPFPLMVTKVPPSELPVIGETSAMIGRDFKVTELADMPKKQIFALHL